MLAAQGVNFAFQGAVVSGQFTQLAEGILHLAFLRFELAPVLVQLGLVAAAQQHVLPFLHLGFEIQVGHVDQRGGFQRPFKQAAVGLHAVGQKTEAGQCGDQNQRQAAAEQGEDLRAQGFLQKHGNTPECGRRDASDARGALTAKIPIDWYQLGRGERLCRSIDRLCGSVL